MCVGSIAGGGETSGKPSIGGKPKSRAPDAVVGGKDEGRTSPSGTDSTAGLNGASGASGAKTSEAEAQPARPAPSSNPSRTMRRSRMRIGLSSEEAVIAGQDRGEAVEPVLKGLEARDAA